MKKVFLSPAFFLMVACDPSDVSTYKSCKITKSEAIFAADRANDVAQCWDGVSYKDKSDAMNWCAGRVNSYMDVRYLFGHTVEYQISSKSCPKG